MAEHFKTPERIAEKKERVQLVQALLIKGYSSGYGFNRIVAKLYEKKGYDVKQSTISKDVKKALDSLSEVKRVIFSKKRIILTLEQMLDDVTQVQTESAREDFDKIATKIKILNEINKIEGNYEPEKIQLVDDPFTKALMELEDEQKKAK